MNSDSEMAHKNCPRVCLMGASLDTSNMGVSALAASLRKIIHEIYPDAHITLLIGNRSSRGQELQITHDKRITLDVVNFRLSPRARIHEHLLWILLLACVQKIVPFKGIRKKIIDSNPFLSTIDHADFIGDIRGGDSFSDMYGISRLLIGSIPAITALLLKKRLTLLPQTYGPYKSTIGRHIAKFIITRASYVLSRDREGIHIFKTITGNESGRYAEYCPDVAFRLDSIMPEHADIQPPLNSPLMAPLIGFNVNALMYHGGYTRNNMFNLKLDYKGFTALLIERLLEKTSAHILLIPHTYSPHVESDPDASREAIKSLPEIYKDRVHIVAREYDQSEIKAIIGRCDFFIGSRMHACIAALSQGIPTVGIAYSQKFKGVFESIGVEDMVIDGRDADTSAAIAKIIDDYNKRDGMKALLKRKIDFAQTQIMSTFKSILSE